MQGIARAVVGCLLAAALVGAVGVPGLPGSVPLGATVNVRIAPSALPPPVYPVNGTLTDNLTKAPIPGAEVLASSGPNTTTAPNGSYSLMVNAGPETFTFTEEGYHTRQTGFNLAGPRIEDVVLVPFVWALTGSILDSVTSTPIIGALVTAYPSGVSATTGITGQYRLSLENGTYSVNASAAGFVSVSVYVTMNASPLSKFLVLPPAGGSGGGGADPSVLLGVGLGVAAAVVGLGYLVLSSWGYRVRFRRLGPLAGIPAERDPNLPPSPRSTDRSRYPRRRH